VFVTDDPDEGEMFVEARRIAIPAIETRGALMLEDVGAPVPVLPDLLAAIADVAAAYDVPIPVIAHAGDGNTHPIVVFDPTDAESEKRALEAFREVMQRAIDLGGTITGEHGVGRTKKELLPTQLGPEVMELTRRVKAALDPDGILNPGAIL
jgi:glycolate oxidase